MNLVEQDQEYFDSKMFNRDAKDIIDSLYNAKCFADHMTRDDFNELQDYVALCLSIKERTYRVTNDILKSFDEKKNKADQKNIKNEDEAASKKNFQELSDEIVKWNIELDPPVKKGVRSISDFINDLESKYILIKKQK